MLSLRQLCGATTLLLSGQVALADLGIQADNVGMSSKKTSSLTPLECTFVTHAMMLRFTQVGGQDRRCSHDGVL